MRIALLIRLAPRKLGSLEAWIVAFASEARRRGHTVDVFGMEPIHADVARALRDLGAGWDTLEALERRPLAGARRLARDYDVLHLNLFSFSVRDSIFRLAYAAGPARVLFVDHNSEVVVAAAPAAGRARPGLTRRMLGRATALRTAGVAGVSDYVRNRAGERLGLMPPFVRTLYNGVNISRFTPPLEPRTATREIRIVTVAYLIFEKGVDVVLRAVAESSLPNLRVTVVGDGPEDARLRALSTTLGISPRVEFLGLRDDVDELLRGADILVHPARCEEAFGLTVAEAMASGCVVIASRIGAIPELIVDGESGILVPPGDTAALASALTRVAADPGIRHSLGAAARRRAVERFSLDACASRHIDWCEEAGTR